MSSREAILDRIRSGLGVKAADNPRRAAVEARISAKTRHPTPERVRGKSADQLRKLLRGFLEGQSATVLEVDRHADIPIAVARYLRDNNLAARIRVGSDPILTQIPWGREPQLEVLLGPARPSDEAGLSHAAAAVAESGTLVLASGVDNPVTIAFLPETHIVLVEEENLVGPYEDAWVKVRSRFGERMLPRTINMISGPSRTGDIGGKLVMGAHGPRRMCVVLVKSKRG
jgi:L-lactate dehydrogenase complex protein LldG